MCVLVRVPCASAAYFLVFALVSNHSVQQQHPSRNGVLHLTPIAQADFLIERLGGPKLYTRRKGKHHRLIHRHSPYDLNPKSAARWLEVRMHELVHHLASWLSNVMKKSKLLLRTKRTKMERHAIMGRVYRIRTQLERGLFVPRIISHRSRRAYLMLPCVQLI